MNTEGALSRTGSGPAADGEADRQELLRRLADAGRALSDAAVMFHTAAALKLGLGTTDWKTLGLLEKHGRLTAGELSEKTGLAPPSVTGILDRLERGRWIRRDRDDEDRRRVIVELAPAAGRRAGGLFEGLTRRLEDLYAVYDEAELELLVDFLEQLARRQREATAELEGTAPTGPTQVDAAG